MRGSTDKSTAPGSMIEGCTADYRFYCKLFDDMVQKSLCLTRRSELNKQEGFSCAGCSKDIIISSINRRRRTLQA